MSGDRAGGATPSDDAWIANLEAWMARHVPGGAGPLEVERLSGGASNLTFRVGGPGGTWVLRRPPTGALLETAHDMSREVRVQRGLDGTGVPVPRVVASCEDPAYIGAPFYLMEWIDGVVYATRRDAAHLTEDQARAASFELVDVAAQLHAIDFEKVGLSGHGRPEGFLERNLLRWCRQWEQAKQRELPRIDELAERLHASLPRPQPPGIVHGDFGFNNALYARREPARMLALLDWEMSTLGDPLTDLGLLLAYWGPVGERLFAERGGQAHRANAGFPSADALVERYAAGSRRCVEAIDFYEVFGIFKLAVICEGALARMKAGSFTGQAAEETAAMVEFLVEAALERAARSPLPALRGGRAPSVEAPQP